MRPITRKMLRILQSEEFDPFHLMSIQLPGMSTPSIRITDAGKSITYDSASYAPCFFSTSDQRLLLATDSGEQPSITVSIGNVDRQIASIINQYETDGSEVLIHKWDRRIYESGNLNDRDAIFLARGRLKNGVISDQTFSFEVVEVITLIEQAVIPRRIFQSGCNYVFGSKSCGADASISPNRITTEILSGSDRRRIKVGAGVLSTAGSPTDPTDYWKNGYVLIKSGVGIGQSRAIQGVREYDGDTFFYVRDPFLIDPTIGEDCIIQRGCPRTKEACEERQGDVLSFGGFDAIPSEIRPVIELAREPD